MRRLMTLAVFSLTGALIQACGDDDAPGGNGGTGGSAGNAGSGGNAGVAGAAGNGGDGGGSSGTGGSSAGTGGSSAGTGGTGGSGTGGTGGSGDDPDAGDGGGGPPCTGCVEVSVPLDANNENTSFQINISPAADFTNGTITFRVRALTIGAQLVVQPFSTDDSGFDFDGQFTQLNAGNGFVDTESFIDLVYDLSDNDPADVLFPDAGGLDGGSPDPEDHDKSRIIAIGFQLGSAGNFTTDFPDPITLTMLVDSITFTGVAGDVVANRTFTDSAEGFAINTDTSFIPDSEVIHHPE